MDAAEIRELEAYAAELRIATLKSLLAFGSGHLGGSFSIIETFAVLYKAVLTIDAKNPHAPERDRVVLSKGHAGPAWYAALATQGFFDESWLETLNGEHTHLPSHPDRTKTPGVDATTGSLGQGTSVAAGIATALRMKGSSAYTYLICGDGELNEGQCWEAFQYIAHHNLTHLIVLIDENKKQLDGFTKDIMNPHDIVEKMRAFGFSAKRIDGQNVVDIYDAIMEAKNTSNKPSAIVLDTTKGAGIPYFEEMFSNHAVTFDEKNTQEAHKGIAALEKKCAELRGTHV